MGAGSHFTVHHIHVDFDLQQSLYSHKCEIGSMKYTIILVNAESIIPYSH